MKSDRPPPYTCIPGVKIVSSEPIANYSTTHQVHVCMFVRIYEAACIRVALTNDPLEELPEQKLVKKQSHMLGFERLRKIP